MFRLQLREGGLWINKLFLKAEKYAAFSCKLDARDGWQEECVEHQHRLTSIVHQAK